jgi:hypothetical protein
LLSSFSAVRAEQENHNVALIEEAKVWLLYPITSGHEPHILHQIAPSAEIVKMNGLFYVSIGQFEDVAVAYRLGKTIQKRYNLVMELAFDDGHPQSSGEWIKKLEKVNAGTSNSSTENHPKGTTSEAYLRDQPQNHPDNRNQLKATSSLTDNKAILYLYAKHPDPSSMARKSTLTGRRQLVTIGTSTYKLAGVYTDSPTGQRLMKNRIAELERLNPNLLVLKDNQIIDSYNSE